MQFKDAAIRCTKAIKDLMSHVLPVDLIITGNGDVLCKQLSSTVRRVHNNTKKYQDPLFSTSYQTLYCKSLLQVSTASLSCKSLPQVSPASRCCKSLLQVATASLSCKSLLQVSPASRLQVSPASRYCKSCSLVI